LLDALPRVVRLSSERVRQAVRQDCPFAKKQASPPALLVVIQRGRELAASGDARLSNEQRILGSRRRSATAQIRPTRERAGARRVSMLRRYAPAAIFDKQIRKLNQLPA
jgi:hypothetical protein